MGQTFAGISQSDPDKMSTGTKMLEGGTQGLMKGFQDYQQQNAQMRQGGGGGMMPMPQAQPVSPDYFTPTNPMTKKPGNNVNFYGGGQ